MKENENTIEDNVKEKKFFDLYIEKIRRILLETQSQEAEEAKALLREIRSLQVMSTNDMN